MSDYQVLFSGVVAESADVTRVERKLAATFGIELAKAKRLFNGRTVVLANALSRDEALELQITLQAIGAIARIKCLTQKIDAQPRNLADSRDGSSRDGVASHIDCPRCGHLQLEATHCSHCGVDLEALFRIRHQEERLMEYKRRGHRQAQQRRAAQAADGHGSGATPIAAQPKTVRGPASAAAKGGFFARLFKRSA